MGNTRFSAVAKDDFVHLRGDEAHLNNIAAARGIAETVRSTLGPAGLDKMIVSSDGSVIITNDGETILKEIDTDHPAASVLVEVAKSQAEQVGDGTTTAVLLASELLSEASDLLEQGIHPTVIVDGYQRVLDRFSDDLNEMVQTVDTENEQLCCVAESSLTGKIVAPNRRVLVTLILDATAAVTVDNTVDLDYLKIVSRVGASACNSELCHGAVIDEKPCYESMPTELSNANVMLIQHNLEMIEPETEVIASIDSIESRDRFLEHDDKRMVEVVQHIADLGVDVVFCNGRVDDRAKPLLASKNILAVEHIKRTDTDFEFLQEVTGGTAVTDPTAATRDQLGCADISRDGPFYIENPETHGVTLVVHGSTEHIAAEIERNIEDAIDVVTRTVFDGRLLPGGGASEIRLADRLREYATSVEGRTQLTIEAFAVALESIPQSLARNAGIDPTDALIDLRTAHANGRADVGLNAATGELVNAFDAGIVQPAHVTEQTVYNAAKAAAIILGIDEVISASELSKFREKYD